MLLSERQGHHAPASEPRALKCGAETKVPAENLIEQNTGREVAWINQYLDREHVRRLADKSLYSYAHSLLPFVRWWESVHHTGDISQQTSPNRLCSITCASSRAGSLRLLPPPSTIASPVPIVRSAISSPMLPVR